jgi:hypothetical protein
MEREQHRLPATNSREAIKKDTFMNVSLSNKSKLLPLTDIHRVLNIQEQFNKERQKSGVYRLLTTVNTTFNNVLFDLTTWNTLNLMRDQSIPPNNTFNDDADFNFDDSIKNNINIVGGWYGKLEKINVTNNNSCIFTQFTPTANKFSLLPYDKGGNVYVKNWEVKVTYPKSKDSNHYLVNGGLLIVDKFLSIVGGRQMLGLTTPTKHGLTQGDFINIYNLTGIYTNKQYRVVKLGNDKGELNDYSFVIDVEKIPTANISTDPVITSLTRFKRVINGEESSYYFRIFSTLTDLGDYEVYPLAYSKTLYNDKMVQISVNQDIDVTGLVDNLGRPLSELYFTFIKTNSDNTFTNVKSGVKVPFLTTLDVPTPISPNSQYRNVSDINRIHNGGNNPMVSHTPLETSVLPTNTDFYGDVVEYNKFELVEKVIAEVHHRFNSINREMNSTLLVDSTTLTLGPRYEGTYYKPHHLIKIRNYSNFIEQGDSNTVGVPDYAEDLGDGTFMWRDLMDIGFNDGKGLLDYPFLNGAHYIHSNIRMWGRRQDPFNKYNLYYNTYPKDIYGEASNYKDISTNDGGDNC